MLDGYQTVEEYAAYCNEKGYKAAAITDHGVCTAHEKFEYEVITKGYSFKPIFGIEAYLTDDVTNHTSNRVARDKKGNIKYDKKTGEPMLEPQKPRDFNHGCIWAKTSQGLANLWTLDTLAFTDGFYYKPRIDLPMMKQYHDGLFVSDGCLLSQVARAATEEMYADTKDDKLKAHDKGYAWIQSLVDIFGKDNVLIELHTWQFVDPKDEGQIRLNAEMRAANFYKLEIAKAFDLRTIAVNDAHYNRREDHIWHDLEWATTTGKGVEYNDDKIEGRGETAAWVMTTDEVRYWLLKHDLPSDAVEESIANTSWVADQCNVKLDRGMRPPRFMDTRQEDEQLFDKRVLDGFKELVPRDKIGVYMEELNKEVELIKKADLTGYFNTVSDYANFVRDEDLDGSKYGIPGKKASLLGPGRGSAGGSLVCYLMHITNVDPVNFGLFFERFLTAGRVMNKVHVEYEDGHSKDFDASEEIELADGTKKEAWQQLDEHWETADGRIANTSFEFRDCPDIDLDFEMSIIPQLNEYLLKRYGKYNVSQIGTQLLLKMSSAIKDIGKVNGMTPTATNDLVRRIVATGWPVEDWISEHTMEEFVQWMCVDHRDDVVADLLERTDFFDQVWNWCGRFRGEGIHASGYIISKKSMLGALPLRVKNGMLVTQFEHEAVARLGFIKYDILKLSSLAVVRDSYELTHDGNLNIREIYREMRDERMLSQPGVWDATWTGDTVGIFQMDTPLGNKTALNSRISSLRDAAMLSAVDRPGMVNSGLINDFYNVRLGKTPAIHYHPMLDDILDETSGFVVYQEQIMSIFGKLCGYTPTQRDGVRKIIARKLRWELPKQKDVLYKCCLANPDFVRLVPSNYNSPEECLDDIWRGIENTGQYAFNKSHSLAYGMITSIQEYYKCKYPEQFMVATMNNNMGDSQYVIYAKVHGIDVLPPNVNHSTWKYELADGKVYMPLSTIKGVGGTAVSEIVSNGPYSSFDDYVSKTSGRGGRKKNIVTSLISVGAFDGVDDRDRFQLMVDYRKSIGEQPPTRNTWKSARIRGRIEEELLGISLSYDPVFDDKDWLYEQGPQSIVDVSKTQVGSSVTIAGKVESIRRHQQRNGGTMAWVTVQLVSHEIVQVTMFASSYGRYKDLFATGDLVAINGKRTEDYNGKMSIVGFSVHNRSIDIMEASDE